MRVWIVVLLLAGCAAPIADEEMPLVATETTGIIRGVVVDDAINPVAGANVTLRDGTSGVTDADGAFGFDGLAPGLHFLDIDAAGFHTVSTQAEVVAGEPMPPLVRVRLVALPVFEPYVEPASFSGHLECSVTVTLDFSACSFPQFIFDQVGYDPLDDRQLFFFEVGEDAHWVQLEMIWRSTQPLGSHMALNLDATNKDGSGWFGVDGSRGPSPLMAYANTTRSQEAGYGNTTDVMMRIFSSDLPESRLPDPCIPRPILGYCFLGVGATIGQKVDLYLHVFHHTTPREGWLFAHDGAP